VAARALIASGHGAEKQHQQRQSDELNFKHDHRSCDMPFVTIGRGNSSFGSNSSQNIP
jgi:hypothetical protein